MENVKEKTYTLRINMVIKRSRTNEVEKDVEMIMNELPRMEGVYKQGYSIYDIKDKKIIKDVTYES
jgi:hypothetical protein